jgi:hypothetical protein
MNVIEGKEKKDLCIGEAMTALAKSHAAKEALTGTTKFHQGTSRPQNAMNKLQKRGLIAAELSLNQLSEEEAVLLVKAYGLAGFQIKPLPR